MTSYYNYLNLPYKITGAENDETQVLYGADGSLFQRKYIKNSVQISKRDYLRDKEFKSDILESIKHEDGRILKIGNQYNFEYWIKDHLGNIRVTFSDNNGNGLLVGDEIRSRNDYYPFGLEWNNRWELGDTISPLNLKRFNGKELLTEMNLNLLFFENRLLDRELDRFNTVDKLSWHPKQVDKSPYSAMWNNPFRYNDPDGNCPQCLGFVIGFATELALQKLTGQEINLGKALLSGGAGALSGGLSTLKNVGTVGKLALGAAIDASESVSKQVIDGKGVSTAQVISDVVMSGVAGQAKVVSNEKMKALESVADRTKRVAAGDPASTNRALAATGAKIELSAAKGANQVVGSVSGDAAQTTSDVLRSTPDKKPEIKIKPVQIVQDNTRVVKIY